MGVITSKVKHNDYNLYTEEKINVNFCQITQISDCNVAPEQLMTLLGLNIPKYCVYGGREYSYVFCVSSIDDISEIIKENGYEIRYIQSQKVCKHEFNSYYKVDVSLNGNISYKLSPIK